MYRWNNGWIDRWMDDIDINKMKVMLNKIINFFRD